MTLLSGENPTLGASTLIEQIGGPTVSLLSLVKSTESNTTSSIIYASPNGSDLNNGLTWGTAKQTIAGALVALPGGASGLCGNGVIYFLDGTNATSVGGQGVWLMGPNDPNYGNPPAGWLKGPNQSLSIIGVPTRNYGPTPHLGRATIVGGDGSTNLKPGVWISSAMGALYFANININYPARAWVLGVDSNNAITPANSGVAGLTFYNCTGSVSGNTGLGPTWTIGGESFWIELIDCGGAGSIGSNGHVPADDTAQAFLIDGRGSSGGQIINFKGYTNLAQGGIKFYGGSNDISQVSIEDATEEGSFSNPSPVAPVYWVASGGQGNIVRIGSALIADGGSTPMPAVQNDGGAQIFVSNAWGQAINTQGPMITVADYNNNYQALTLSPARQNQSGFFGGWGSHFPRVFGQHDDARCNPLALTRFLNTASFNAVSWTPTTGSGVTIITGIADKYAGTNAARVANINTFFAGVNFFNGNVTFAIGDWVIIGGWIRSNSGNGNIQFPLSYFLNTAGFSFGGTTQLSAGSFIQGDGEWQYLIGLAKVSAIGTNPCFVEFQGLVDSTHVTDFFAPVALHLATGTVSDNEANLIALSLISNRSDAPIGSVSTPPTLRLMTDGLQMPKITTAISAPGAEMGFLRWEAGTNAGTLKLVAYAGTSITGTTIIDNIGAGN